jgi:hypothetical protein
VGPGPGSAVWAWGAVLSCERWMWRRDFSAVRGRGMDAGLGFGRWHWLGIGWSAWMRCVMGAQEVRPDVWSLVISKGGQSNEP